MCFLGKTANTQVTSGGHTYTIGDGGSVDLELAGGVTTVVTASEPVLAVHIVQPTAITNDITAAILVPEPNLMHDYTFGVPTLVAGASTKVALVTTTTDTATVKVDNSAPGGCSWTSIDGSTFSSSVCSVTAGSHMITQSCQTIGCYVMSESPHGAYAYSAGLSLSAFSAVCSKDASTADTATEVLTEVLTGPEDSTGDEAATGTGTSNDKLSSNQPMPAAVNTTVTTTKPSTINNEDTNKVVKDYTMHIVVGSILGGIPIFILFCIIIRSVCFSSQSISSSKVQILKQPLSDSPPPKFQNRIFEPEQRMPPQESAPGMVEDLDEPVYRGHTGIATARDIRPTYIP